MLDIRRVRREGSGRGEHADRSNEMVLFGRAAWGGQKFCDGQQGFIARVRRQPTDRDNSATPSRALHVLYRASKGVVRRDPLTCLPGTPIGSPSYR